MTLNEYTSGFFFGCFGGMAVEVLRLYKLRTSKKLPPYYKTKFYWIVTILMTLLGGGLVFTYLYSSITVTPILALNVGASAPLILASLAEGLPPISPGSTDTVENDLNRSEELASGKQ